MPIIPTKQSHFMHNACRVTAAGDYYRNSTNQLIGIVNTWTIAVWIKTTQQASAERIVEIKNSGSNVNRIYIIFNDSTGSVQVLNAGPTGTTIKTYTWTNICPAQNWQHICITWDGTTLLGYFNGVARTPDTLNTDNSGTMTDTNRSIGYGASVTGSTSGSSWNLHSLALWNTVLTAAEVALIYNNGNGSVFDCRNIQRSNLQHWWLVERADSSRGKDYGVGSATLIDIATNGVFTTGSTIVDGPRQLIQTSNFPGHKYCLDFDGTTEWTRSQTAANYAVGIANAWTMMMWMKPMESSFASNRSPWFIGAAATSQIQLNHNGASANDPWQVILRNSGATVFKQYLWNNLINTSQAWQQIVVTWDGTSLLLYSNGSAVSPDTLTTDNAGTMVDASRIVSFGGQTAGTQLWLGRLHSAALWATALSSDQVTSLYNNGSGWNYDIRQASPVQPVHWWLFGSPDFGLCYDRIDSSPGTIIDPSAMPTALTMDDDSIADAPGL